MNNEMWEYSFFEPRKGDTPNDLHWDGDLLNKYGADGWEVIAVIGDGLPTVALLMKRPISVKWRGTTTEPS
jgi:hypothetical protein